MFGKHIIEEILQSEAKFNLMNSSAKKGQD